MPVPAATSYTITNLGTLPGGTQSIAHGINARGWVVGTADTANGQFHAFLAAGGPLIDLGTLGGATSTATSLNADGQVIGQSETAAGAMHAFLYTGLTMLDLGTLGGSSSSLQAFARSAGDRVAPAVGSAETAAGATRAAFSLLSHPTPPLQELGELLGGTNSFATAANAAGLVVGGAETPTGALHAFLFSTSAGVVQDLHTLGGRHSSATGINASGQVVGNSELADGAIHAFLYTGDGLQDLGTLGMSGAGGNSFAKAINSAGLIVGKAGDASGATHASIYDRSMQNLNQLVPASSGWELIEATDLNDSGQIVGYGRFNGQLQGFLLTPEAGCPLGVAQRFGRPRWPRRSEKRCPSVPPGAREPE